MWFRKKDSDEWRKKLLKDFINVILDGVKDWNVETFKGATLSGQLEKLEEEFREFVGAKDAQEARKEFADVMIVLGGLRRFQSEIGKFIETAILERLDVKELENLVLDISEKMEVNKKREWKDAGNGKFHH